MCTIYRYEMFNINRKTNECDVYLSLHNTDSTYTAHIDFQPIILFFYNPLG